MTIPAQALEIDRAAAKAAGYTDEEIDAFVRSGGRETPRFASDATAVKPMDNAAKFGGARQMYPVEGMLRQGARGATLGLSDRMLAGIVAGMDPKVDYDSARTRIDNENRRYEAENPTLALTWNLLGGAPAGAPANALARGVSKGASMIPGLRTGSGVIKDMARSGLTGAGMGAAGAVGYQTGEDDKSVERTIQNALFGAKMGGAMGAAVPVATRAASIGADLTGVRNIAQPTELGQVPTLRGRGTANPLKPEFWSSENAKDVLSRGEGLLFPEQAGRRTDRRLLDMATDGGKQPVTTPGADFAGLNAETGNAMVMDAMGMPGLRLSRGARGVGNKAAQTFQDAFDARTASLSANMEDDVNSIIARRENVPRGIEARRDVRSQNAAKAYGPVRQDKVTLSPLGRETLLDDPQGNWQKIYNTGVESARLEIPSRKIPPLFGMEEPPKLSSVLGADGMPINAMDVASAPPPKAKLLRDPTVEDIDTMKRGLNTMVSDRANSENANIRNNARLYGKRLEAVLNDADASSPGYAAARKQFGDDSELINAFEGMAKGVDGPFLSTPRFSQATRDQVQDFFSRLSAAGKGEAQRGIAQDLYRMIDDNAQNALNKMASPVRTASRQKLDIAFADKPGASQELAQKWIARDTQQKNQQFVSGGSPTAEKIIDQVEAASLPGRIGQFTYAPDRTVMGLLAEKGVRNLSKRMADETAQRMTLGGPEGQQYLSEFLPDLAKLLEQRTTARRGMAGRAIGTGIGARNALAALFGQQEDY